MLWSRRSGSHTAGPIRQTISACCHEDVLLLDEFMNRRFVDAGDAKVCYRQSGVGPALVFFHGYPLSGQTWEKIVVALSKQFTCYAFDLVGLGDSTSRHAVDHSSQGQGRVFQQALSSLGVTSYSLIGNDSGGWVARELALLDQRRIQCLILTNTEIPDHRPPWVTFYQWLALLPGAGFIFRSMIASRRWRRSRMGFGGCFDNLDLIDEEFATFLLPLLLSEDRMCRALRFLINMKFRRIDQFKTLHRELKMPVGLIWGAADPTFPENLAREMSCQFPNVVGFRSIPEGKLFMHEEFHEQVVEALIEFLGPAA
jgi:pimeloyl-ACP methyl ester carboxylesterase